MTRDAALLGKLYDVTRGDLERATFQIPSVAELTTGVQFARLRRLSAFWADDLGSPDALRRSVTDLLTGLHAQARPWVFAISSTPAEIACWFGAAGGQPEAIGELLVGAFPDVHLEFAKPCFLSGSLPRALAITGTPSSKQDHHGAPMDQTERFVRGLAGRTWLYLVRGDPVPAPHILKALNDVTSEIKDASSTFLLKQNAIDDSDRTARRYVELLEAKLHQLEQARTAGMWHTRVFFLSDTPQTLSLARGLLCSAFGGTESAPEPIRCCECSTTRDADVPIEPLNTPDAAVFVCPPREEHSGYGITEYARYGVDLDDPAPAQAIRLGHVVDAGRTTSNPCSIHLAHLTKHGLIAGVTGSGKTNTCVHLLVQAKDHGVPCLIIESAKSEYRTLLHAAGFDRVNVFTLGNEIAAPFRLNPFEVPIGASVQTHVDYLKSLFAAAFVLYPPMPYVLEQCVQELYEDCGWDVARNQNRRGVAPLAFPTLSDLAEKIPTVVDRMGYDQRMTMDVKAGLLARIDQLRRGGGKGLMLDTRRSIPDPVLFEESCLLELKSLVSDDEKAFLIGLILIRLYEHCEGRVLRDGLRHLTLIEEAHRLLRNTSTEQTSEISANPRGRAIEVFANILSEIRAYGEGILLAEQAPTKLVPDAIRNTNLKVIHRIVAADDRLLVGSSMRLNDRQQRRLALLETGEAVVFREGLFNPIMIRVPKLATSGAATDDAGLALRMEPFYDGHSWLLDPLLSCRECPQRAGAANCLEQSRSRPGPRFLLAFRRFFNDLRFVQSSLQESFADLKEEYEARRTSDRPAFHCAVRHAVHEELTRRGRIFQWRFDDLERAVSHAMTALVELSGTVGSAAVGHPLASVQAFATTLAALENPGTRPFSGCAPCRQVCRFQLDVADAVSSNQAVFRNAFSDKSVRWGSLVKFCRNSVSDAVPHAEPPIRNAAALCFAVQQLDRLRTSPALQRELSGRFAERLTQGVDDGAL